MNCPYCNADCKPRGLKNHVRMSGGEHGESGDVPNDYEDRIADTKAEDAEDGDADSGDSKPADGGADSVESDATEVSPNDFGDDSAGADADSGDADGSDEGEYPFDPTDEDAIRLDGGEVVDIQKNGEVYPGVEADEGDYLLRTDAGPVLYDADDDEFYEVLTA